MLGEAAAGGGGAADVEGGGTDGGAEEVAAIECGEGAGVHGCGSEVWWGQADLVGQAGLVGYEVRRDGMARAEMRCAMKCRFGRFLDHGHDDTKEGTNLKTKARYSILYN